MKSLALNIPNVNDATSFYRAAYPLGDLRKRCTNLQGNMMQTWSEAAMSLCDGAFFQRPFTKDHLQAIFMAKEVGLKVWVDYDDYLLAVPTDNPTYAQYNTKDSLRSVQEILKTADIITVSTEALREYYHEYNKNIVVVPNALNTSLACVQERAALLPKRSKIVAWRGSKTHQRDAFSYAKAIISSSRGANASDWSWHFIGDNLWFITDSMPHHNTYTTKAMGPIEYMKHIYAIKPSAFIVPLHKSEFNLAKSNIAWMEAAFAGACAIVPDWPEWKKPGALTYKSEAEFYETLQAVLNGEVNCEAKAAESWDYIQQELTLRHVNEKRIDVVCELFNCTRAELGVM